MNTRHPSLPAAGSSGFSARLSASVLLFSAFFLIQSTPVRAANSPPKAAFLQPAQGEGFVSPAEILFRVEAADADGTVSTVELFWEMGSLGKATADPVVADARGLYQLTWHNAPAGDHKLVAQVTDNEGLTAYSESLVIFIKPQPVPPAASLEILRPAHRSVFGLSDPVTIVVSAVDPKGDIRHVEFYANGELIGTSDHLTKEAVIPGRPIQHFLEWRPTANGLYQISAMALDTDGKPVESRPITVFIGEQPPVVSISATTAETREPAPNIRVQAGVFTLRRTGSTTGTLTVSLLYDGSATPGLDYQPLPSVVTFPAGAGEVQLLVQPLEDEIYEGLESVAAILVNDASDSVPAYLIDPQSSAAKLAIYDSNVPPVVELLEITAPRNGQAFKPGEPITIAATAVDPNGYIARVEFYDFETLIGESQLMFFRAPDPGTPIHHTFEWMKAPIGEHMLTARAIDSKGNSLMAKAIFIKVTPEAGMPAVQVATVDSEGTEFSPMVDAVDPVRFSFTRDGDLSQELYVIFSLHGTAEPEKDYKRPDRLVRIPAGEREVVLEIVPVSDELDEPMETVSVRLEDPMPISSMPVPPTAYSMPAYAREAAAVIYDRQRPEQGAVELALPGQGEVYLQSQPVPLIAAAFHPTADLGHADFYADGQWIGSSDLLFFRPNMGGLIVHRFDWQKSIPGDHVITARARLPDGSELFSSKVSITIRGDQTLPAVTLLSPSSGSIFTVGDVVEIIATTRGSDRPIEKLEILADEQLLESTKLTDLAVKWTASTLGTHVLQARALDSTGAEIGSFPVKILVVEAEPDGFVRRELSSVYIPGNEFKVELKAEPPPGTVLYALEDQPPAGWSVTQISDAGQLDPATGRVKFSVANDDSPRTFTYTLTPPADASSLQEFKGSTSADNKEFPIVGRRMVELVATGGAKQLALPQLKRIERQRDGKLRLDLVGTVNQSCILEMSSDLVHWSELTRVFLADGAITYEDTTADGQKRFYRTRLP